MVEPGLIRLTSGTPGLRSHPNQTTDQSQHISGTKPGAAGGACSPSTHACTCTCPSVLLMLSLADKHLTSLLESQAPSSAFFNSWGRSTCSKYGGPHFHPGSWWIPHRCTLGSCAFLLKLHSFANIWSLHASLFLCAFGTVHTANSLLTHWYHTSNSWLTHG